MKQSSLTSNDIDHISTLAHLFLTDDEKSLFAIQLSAILDFISKLQKVSTTNIEPTSQITGLQNVFREDEIDTSRMLSQKQALANAPATYKGYFQVKAIFGE